MEVAKESVVDLFTGHTVVGVSRVRVVTADFEGMLKGILIRAPGSGDPTPNTASIWVGGNGVTADSSTNSGGMPLPPGESLFIPAERLNKLFVISTAADQDLAWMAM